MFIIVLKPFYCVSTIRNKNVLQYFSSIKGGRGGGGGGGVGVEEGESHLMRTYLAFLIWDH